MMNSTAAAVVMGVATEPILHPETIDDDDAYLWAKGLGFAILASLVGACSKLLIRKSYMMLLLQGKKTKQQQRQQEERYVDIIQEEEKSDNNESSGTIIRENNTISKITNTNNNNDNVLQKSLHQFRQYEYNYHTLAPTSTIIIITPLTIIRKIRS